MILQNMTSITLPPFGLRPGVTSFNNQTKGNFPKDMDPISSPSNEPTINVNKEESGISERREGSHPNQADEPDRFPNGASKQKE